MHFGRNALGSTQGKTRPAVIERLEARQLLSATPRLHLVDLQPQVQQFPVLTLHLQSSQTTPFETTASVHWGDGQVSRNVGLLRNSQQLLTLDDGHEYARPGTYHIRVDLVQGGKDVGVFREIRRVNFAGDGVTVHAAAGRPFSGVLGTIKLQTNEPAPGSGVVTQVDWGDGTSTSEATLTPIGGGRYQIKATHAYADPGHYTITVRTTDNNQTVFEPDFAGIGLPSRSSHPTWMDLQTTAIVRKGHARNP